MRSFVLRSTFTARKDGSFFIVFLPHGFLNTPKIFLVYISDNTVVISVYIDRGLIGVDFATIRTVR